MKKPLKIKLLFIFSVVLILTAASILGVHYFWDTEHQTRLFERKFQTFFQRPAHIHKACLRIFPRIQVILEGVEIKNHDRKSDFMVLKKLRMGVAIKPLFTGTIQFEVVNLDQPRITIIRNQKKEWNVSDLLQGIADRNALEKEKKKFWFKKLRFRLGKLTVHKGDLTFKDNGAAGSPITFSFRDINLQTGKFAASGPISVMIKCRLENAEKSARLHLRGQMGPILDKFNLASTRFKGGLEVADFDVSSLAPYLSAVKGVGAPQGVISGTASFVGSLEGKFEAAAKLDVCNLQYDNQDIFEKRLEVPKTCLDFSLTRDNKGISLPHVHVTLPGLTATGTLMIPNAETPSMEAEVKIEKCKYEDLLSYFPISLFPKAVKEVMTEQILTGSIDSFHFHYSETGSRASPNPKDGRLTTAEGKMTFHDFSIKFADGIPLLTHLNGELTLEDSDLKLINLTGRFGNSQMQQGTMSLSKLSFLDTSLALKLDLYEVLKLLHDSRIPESAGHRLRRLKYMDGTALLKLDVSGPLDDLGALAFGGKMELLRANIDYQHFRKLGKDLKGTIHFTPIVIKSDNLEGWWANSPVTSWFKIENYLSPKALLTVHVESKEAEINDLASAFFPWEGVYGEGLVDIKADFSCPGYRTQDLYFEGSATFSDLSLVFPALPHPFTHIGGKVGFSSRGLLFSPVKAKTGSSAISFVGRWDNLHNPIISGKLEATETDLADFCLRPAPEKKEQQAQYNLDSFSVRIESGRFKDLMFNDLKTSLMCHDGKLTIVALSAKSGKFREFDFVNLNNLRENKPVEIAYQNRIATIPYIALESQSGTWVGTSIKVPLWSEDTESFSLTSTIENIPVEEFLECFAPDQRRLTGTLNLHGSVSGAGKNPFDCMKTLQGEANLTVEDGVLKKGGIIAKILSLLNVSRIFSQDYSNLLAKGMHYNTIQGTFNIEQGIARTDRFFLDGPSVKMDAVGDINLRKKAYDMEIAVAPLETVDKVVGKIPILGTVLMGDEGAVVITYYKLTGSFENPKLDQVVFKSLGRKAQGIFQRLFKLPETILDLNSKGSPKKSNGSEQKKSE